MQVNFAYSKTSLATSALERSQHLRVLQCRKDNLTFLRRARMFTVLIDGLAAGAAFERGTSYAEQLDVHEPTQTVREALRFSASLGQPYETPLSEKYSYVEEIISLLEREDIADAIIHNTVSGLAFE